MSEDKREKKWHLPDPDFERRRAAAGAGAAFTQAEKRAMYWILLVVGLSVCAGGILLFALGAA